MWFPLALLSAVLYASMWIFARASRGMPPAFVTAAASVWAPPMLVWSFVAVDYPWHDVRWQAYLPLPLLIVPLTLWCLTFAGQRTDVSMIKPLSALSTIAALAVSMVFFGQQFRASHIVGVMVITVGLLLLYHGRWRAWRTPWPWIALASVLVLGANAAVIRQVLLFFNHPVALVAFLATASFCVNAALALRGRKTIRITRRGMLLLFAFAAATLLQDLFTITALSLGPAPHVIAVKRTSILFAAVFSYAFLGERDQPLYRLLGASVVVVLGVGLLSR